MKKGFYFKVKGYYRFYPEGNGKPSGLKSENIFLRKVILAELCKMSQDTKISAVSLLKDYTRHS